MLARVISVLIGYVCGNFITGYFLAKRRNVDLKKEGSGNVGSTNTMRTLGVRVGLLAFFGDMGKVFLAGLISYLIFHASFVGNAGILLYYAGIGAVFGHVYPVYLKGGGKGVACTAAMVIMSCPKVAPLSFIVFVVVVLLTRYVSLGSIIAELSFLIQLFICGQMGWLALSGSELIEAYVISVLSVALSIFKHRSNIKRLLHHEESKFKINKKTAEKN